MTTVHDVRRAKSVESIEPLMEMCKTGKLFDVQEWVAAGNPVNPPPLPTKGHRKKTPLQIAIELGFHSLVEVLLKAGAVLEPDDWRSPMSMALTQRRFDLIKLLVAHGYDPTSIDMKEVFQTWDPEIMEYFIDLGADVEGGNPLAYALCNRIQTSLRILKRDRDRFPSFQEQANIALRHHAKEGNLKWVSLLLWAGADPYARGDESWQHESRDGDSGLSALGFAALYEHFDVFDLKQVRLKPDEPELQHVLTYACDGQGMELLKRLLELGVDPNDQANGGSSAVQHALVMMGWSLRMYTWERETNIDSSSSRERMKAIHVLAKSGARWAPQGRSELNSARQSLVRLVPDYTVEFVWIMQKYQACCRETIQRLIDTPKMRTHIKGRRTRIDQLLGHWEEG